MVDAALQELSIPGVEVEYVALVDPVSFEELEALTARGLLVVAARVGGVRLIDNTLLSVPAGTGSFSSGEAVASCSA